LTPLTKILRTFLAAVVAAFRGPDCVVDPLVSATPVPTR